ncbi:MAG: hypothetical protein LC790_15585 [Actinobacteria bacterium]|nr:hypothetical protein [Actinomycetota bacterium]
MAGAQQVLRGNLAVWVDRDQIPGEPAHHPEPLTPGERPCVDREPCPRDRQIDGDALRSGLLEEVNESFQQPPLLLELGAELATDP